MNKRALALAFFVIGAGLIGWWATTVRTYFTLTKIPHEVVSKDDFGDEVKKIEWQEKFAPGLLDVILPADGACSVIGVGLLLLDARSRKKNKVG